MGQQVTVRIVIECTVDLAAYVAAGIEADWYSEGDLDPTYAETACIALGYLDADDKMPRWARDTITVISQTAEVLP